MLVTGSKLKLFVDAYVLWTAIGVSLPLEVASISSSTASLPAFGCHMLAFISLKNAALAPAKGARLRGSQYEVIFPFFRNRKFLPVVRAERQLYF